MSGFNSISVESGSDYSASDSPHVHPLWLNRNVSSSPLAKNLNLNLKSTAQCSKQTKQCGLRLHDQYSSSTQSTGHSHQDLKIVREENAHQSFLSEHSGRDDINVLKETVLDMNSLLSLGTPETTYSTPKVNFSDSDAGISFACIDPCFGGMLASYRPHGITSSQFFGNQSGRVPLPIQVTNDEPVYVNAKQYHGILRRRQQRAKLAAMNKLSKDRKPYLHESRHRHAMRRIRGPGGRFLNTKQLKQQEEEEQLGWRHQQAKSHGPSIDGKASSAPSQIVGEGERLWGYSLDELMNGNGSSSGDSSASDITNVSHPGDPFELADHLGFSGFLGGSTGVRMLYGSSHPRVPVIR